MNKELFYIIMIGAIGSLFQEILHWYNLRGKLSHQKYKKLITSRSYWLITLAMVLFSGIGTWAWYDKTGDHSAREYFLTGAAFPLFLKKGLAALSANKPTEFGEPKERESLLKEYL